MRRMTCDFAQILLCQSGQSGRPSALYSAAGNVCSSLMADGAQTDAGIGRLDGCVPCRKAFRVESFRLSVGRLVFQSIRLAVPVRAGGAWTALGGARAVQSVIRTRTVFRLAVSTIVFAFVVTMATRDPARGNLLPHWILQPFDPNDKTDLAPYRVVHLIALAIVVTRFLAADSPILPWRTLAPLIKCGQNSLPVFCIGIVLSFCAHAAIELSLNSVGCRSSLPPPGYC
jgi:hypothetical protein